MTISQFPPLPGGVPNGATSDRPSNPEIGTVFYNGTLGIIEIYNGTDWFPLNSAPGAPTIATPTDASSGDAYTSTAGKLSVVFTPSTAGGSVTQFNAFTTAGGFSASSSSTTVTITGLTPGTAYTVYGNSSNGFGESNNTPNAASVTPTTKPEAPSGVTANANAGTTNITVNWTLNNNGGKNLTAITITPYLNGTTAQTPTTAATTTATSATITGLTSGSSYTFRVKTTNANGDSPESTASASVTVPILFNADYLVVAGGGAGGTDDQGGAGSGGGGAGGMRCTVTATGGGGTLESALSVGTGIAYTVTVGAGGVANFNAVPGNASDSTFATITSTRGGYGGGRWTVSGNLDYRAPQSGGSGGGGNGYLQNTGAAGTANQGYAGGTGNSASEYAGSGGGGAGAIGGAQSGSTAGAGGAGVATSISGSSVTYAGGGGGSGSNIGGAGGAGGTGGGGAGGTGGTTATAGTANTGGGGGGGANRPGGRGANGGSGIVVLRIPDTRSATFSGGVTQTNTTSSGYKYYTITAAGTSDTVTFS